MNYFSPSTMGFYNDELHLTMPDDAFSVTDEKYDSIFAELATGKVLAYENGNLITKIPVRIKTWDDIRSTRLRFLKASDYTDTISFQRRSDETVFESWQTYRQQLRDIPTTFSSPDEVVWPTPPNA